MNELALFAGGGGGLYGSRLLGWHTVCAVEIMPANRRMLLQRQADGVFERFPIWDDVRTFDGVAWRGVVDVVSGGFPCQDISVAGTGKGLDGERSGLWHQMARIIGEVRPRYAFIENSPMLVTRGLERVLCDLAEMGFDAEWGVVGAHHAGAPHKRERIWILAHHRSFRHEGAFLGGAYRTARAEAVERCDFVPDDHGQRQQQPQGLEREERGWVGDVCEELADADLSQCSGPRFRAESKVSIAGGYRQHGGEETQWPPEPGVCRVVDGVADWKHRIFALGNGQVPRVVARAFRILENRIHDNR